MDFSYLFFGEVFYSQVAARLYSINLKIYPIFRNITPFYPLFPHWRGKDKF